MDQVLRFQHANTRARRLPYCQCTTLNFSFGHPLQPCLPIHPLHSQHPCDAARAKSEFAFSVYDTRGAGQAGPDEVQPSYATYFKIHPDSNHHSQSPRIHLFLFMPLLPPCPHFITMLSPPFLTSLFSTISPPRHCPFSNLSVPWLALGTLVGYEITHAVDSRCNSAGNKAPKP